MKKYFVIIVLMLFSVLGKSAENVFAAAPSIELNPAKVDIGTFYNGTTVTVSGVIPADAEVVVRLSGENEELHLKKKGKVGGLLWMNTGDLTFENAPRVYKLFTSSGLADLDESGARDFGFAALKERIRITPQAEDNPFLLQEFVRLKEHESLYSLKPGSVTYGKEEGGMKHYQVDMNITPAMKQGSYHVEVAEVSQGRVIGTAEKNLVLQQVSLPSRLSNMAFGNSVWYGIMSVFIALMAGLVMGTIFKGKGGAH